jgi:hypothetical protein
MCVAASCCPSEASLCARPVLHYPLKFLVTALALLESVPPCSPEVSHALCPRQPCLPTPQTCSCEEGYRPHVTLRIRSGGLEG